MFPVTDSNLRADALVEQVLSGAEWLQAGVDLTARRVDGERVSVAGGAEPWPD